jgi:hypothetical protein
MTNTPLPWVAEPIDAEESYESLKEESDGWVAILGNVQLKAGRVEDEIWRGRSFENVALCRRENAHLLLSAPKLLAACKLLLSIVPEVMHADANSTAARATAKEAIAEAEGAPTNDTIILRAAGYQVRPDPDVPGKWVWQGDFYDPSKKQSFDSESDAWRDAGEDYVGGI